MNMVSNVDCILFGYNISQSNISSLIETVDVYDGSDMRDMGEMLLDICISYIHRYYSSRFPTLVTQSVPVTHIRPFMLPTRDRRNIKILKNLSVLRHAPFLGKEFTILYTFMYCTFWCANMEHELI